MPLHVQASLDWAEQPVSGWTSGYSIVVKMLGGRVTNPSALSLVASWDVGYGEGLAACPLLLVPTLTKAGETTWGIKALAFYLTIPGFNPWPDIETPHPKVPPGLIPGECIVS